MLRSLVLSARVSARSSIESTVLAELARELLSPEAEAPLAGVAAPSACGESAPTEALEALEGR